MFNPLDKENLGKSVASALQRQDVESLPPIAPFQGAGAYAIYYTGTFLPYRRLTALNKGELGAWPIYVGKAVPPGSRKGLRRRTGRGTPLFTRLREHARTIEQVKSLQLEDFYCRYLVVDEIWIALTESMLIELYSPVWNTSLEGSATTTLGLAEEFKRVHPGIQSIRADRGHRSRHPEGSLSKSFEPR
jgi:hypothetical protein